MDGVKIQLEEDKTDIICELCGRQMVVKTGRYGKFIACPGYPECKNIKRLSMKQARMPKMRRPRHCEKRPKRPCILWLQRVSKL